MEGIRNRTEPAESNRTEPNNFWNRPGPDAETNRTEPDRATIRKPQAEPRRTGNLICPNRTQPNLTEPNR